MDYSQDISRSMGIGEVGTLGTFSAQQTNLLTQILDNCNGNDYAE